MTGLGGIPDSMIVSQNHDMKERSAMSGVQTPFGHFDNPNNIHYHNSDHTRLMSSPDQKGFKLDLNMSAI